MSELPPESIVVYPFPGVAGCMTMGVDWSSRAWRQVHESYSICAVVPPPRGRSGGSIRYRSWSYDVRPGQVLLMEPGELHVTNAVDGSANFRMLKLDGATIRRAVGLDSDVEIHWRKPFIELPRLHAAVCRLHEMAARRCEPDSLLPALGFLLHDLLVCGAEVGDRASEQRNAGKLDRVRRLLVTRYDQRILFDRVARDLGLSPAQLSRSFRREVGLPPSQFLQELRLSRARSNLAGARTVTEVALEAGFHDHSQLTNMFKAAMGMTPRDYRASLNPKPTHE